MTRVSSLPLVISTAVSILMAALPAQASNIVFTGQNAALFPGANPAANALLMASVNKPSNTGLATGTPTLSQSQILQNYITSQQETAIQNGLFNCTTACHPVTLPNGDTYTPTYNATTGLTTLLIHPADGSGDTTITY